MTAHPGRGLRASIGLTLAGLFLVAPVLFAIGPFTLGLFMVGALLIVAGVLASLALLPGTMRRQGAKEP